MPRLPQLIEPLTDGHVTLREWTEADVPALTANLNDPTIARFTRVPHPYTRAHAEAFLTEMKERRENDEEIALATTSASDGELLGAHNLRITSWEHRRGELGAVVFAAARGRGVSTRAGYLIGRFGIEELGLHRVATLAAADNTAVQLATEKGGFSKREGVLRSYLERDGKRVDMVSYSLLREDL